MSLGGILDDQKNVVGGGAKAAGTIAPTKTFGRWWMAEMGGSLVSLVRFWWVAALLEHEGKRLLNIPVVVMMWWEIIYIVIILLQASLIPCDVPFPVTMQLGARYTGQGPHLALTRSPAHTQRSHCSWDWIRSYNQVIYVDP